MSRKSILKKNGLNRNDYLYNPETGFIHVVDVDGKTVKWQFVTDYGVVEFEGPVPKNSTMLAKKILSWARSEWEAGRDPVCYPAKTSQ